MTSILLMLLITADDVPKLRLITGAVVEINGSSITVANAKDRKKFIATAETAVFVDGKHADIADVSVKDTATVTFAAESGEPTKIQVATEKKMSARKGGKKKPASDEEAATTGAMKTEETEKEVTETKEERRKKREAEREAKLIEEIKKQDAESAKQVEQGLRVNDLGRGAIGFGPFRTRFGHLEVKATKSKNETIELTISIIDPPEKPSFGFPKPPWASNPPMPPFFTKAPKGAANKKTRDGKPPLGPFGNPPKIDPEMLKPPPDPKLYLPQKHEIKGALSGIRMRSSHFSEPKTEVSTRKKGKGNAKPDDPKGIKEVADLLEKQITGDLEDKPKSDFTISLKFSVPSEVVVKQDDQIKLEFDKWTFLFSAENDPKVLTAFGKLFERFRQD